MYSPSIRYPRKVCLAAFFWVTMGFATASAQDDRPLFEDDYLTGDVPEWLEDVGFDDTHGNAPAAEGSSVPMEGASEGEATGAPTAAKQKCN